MAAVEAERARCAPKGNGDNPKPDSGAASTQPATNEEPSKASAAPWRAPWVRRPAPWQNCPEPWRVPVAAKPQAPAASVLLPEAVIIKTEPGLPEDAAQPLPSPPLGQTRYSAFYAAAQEPALDLASMVSPIKVEIEPGLAKAAPQLPIYGAAGGAPAGDLPAAAAAVAAAVPHRGGWPQQRHRPQIVCQLTLESKHAREQSLSLSVRTCVHA